MQQQSNWQQNVVNDENKLHLKKNNLNCFQNFLEFKNYIDFIFVKFQTE